MMAEIINLKQAKKQRDRADKKARAEANRAQFGRTKSERQRTETETEKARRLLDSHQRGDDDEPA